MYKTFERYKCKNCKKLVDKYNFYIESNLCKKCAVFCHECYKYIDNGFYNLEVNNQIFDFCSNNCRQKHINFYYYDYEPELDY